MGRVFSDNCVGLCRLFCTQYWRRMLVGWSVKVLLQHIYGYIRDERSAIPAKDGQRYIDLNPGRLFVQQPPEKERDREAHLNYYAGDYNRGRQLSHCKIKLNQIQQNTRINLI